MEKIIDSMMNVVVNNGRGVMLQLEDREMLGHDKIYLSTILKRQYYVLKDLYKLHDKYPELIDLDIIGSLDCIFKAMHDMSEHCIYKCN